MISFKQQLPKQKETAFSCDRGRWKGLLALGLHLDYPSRDLCEPGLNHIIAL